jgi:Ca2+-binding RTX toxin-like protein
MAYEIWGEVFNSAGAIISQTATSYIIQNTDGTRTEFHGTGFTYGAVFGGSVTSVSRTADNGATVLVNIAAPAQNLGALLALQQERIDFINVFETLNGSSTSTTSVTRVSSTQIDLFQNDGTIIRLIGTGLNREGTTIADFGVVTEARLVAANGVTILNTVSGLSLHTAAPLNGNGFPIEWMMMQGGATTTTAASYSVLDGFEEFGAFFAPIGGSNTFVNNSAVGAFLTFGQSPFGIVINMTSGNAGTATRGTATDTFSGMRNSSGFIAGSELHSNTFNGSAEDDPVFQGGNAADTFYGNGGSDEFYGEGGNDFGYGGTGDDRLDGGVGNDFLYGGADNDVLYGDAGNDRIDGGAGIDTIDYYDSSALYIDLRVATQANTGGDGIDVISSIENVIGGQFADVLIGNAGVNTLYGYRGADALVTLEGDDFAYGGDGDDYVAGRDGNDTLSGDNGRDVLDGGNGIDVLRGGGDDDYLIGGADSDTIYGGDGGFNITDLGDRWLGGDGGDDTIYGNLGTDRLSGGAGNDFLIGGENNDYMTGEAGIDTFVYNALSDGTISEQIGDWQGGVDKLRIDASAFGGGLVAGALAANQLVIGTAANQAFGQFLYNAANGVLYWDADGTGAVTAVAFTRLFSSAFTLPPASLAAADFDIVV